MQNESAGVKIVMVGDKDDCGIINEITKLMDTPPIITAGRTDLLQLGALLAHCALFIGVDSAPMHIAGAVGTPVLALFGATDAALYGPAGAGDVIIKKDLACAPCGRAACNFNHECMEAIEAEEVIAAAVGIFKTNPDNKDG